MARIFRITLLLLLFGLVVVGFALWGAYRATRTVQPFYRQAMELEAETLEKGGQELESRATALYSDTRRGGAWCALFTAEQINGWMAVKLAESHPDLLPEGVYEPRVAITPQKLTLGFRTRHRGIETVVSVDATVLLTEAGDIGIRLLNVQAGSLPLPVMHLADELAQACQELSLPICWSQIEGNPVAIIEVLSDQSKSQGRQFIDTIELLEGELYIAGHTEQAEPDGEVGKEKEEESGFPIGELPEGIDR